MSKDSPQPIRRRPDNFCEFWEVACNDCGQYNVFALGIHPTAASAWWHESDFVEDCFYCGMPLPDEHDTAEQLRMLREPV